MKARMKLVTQWGGPLPRWFPMFHERISASKLIDWELLRVPSMLEWNDRVTRALGHRCRKPKPYSMSDVNPMLGYVLREEFAGYDWWGIINLDVQVGDLDSMLEPLLDDRDMIVMSSGICTSGTFMFWRNTEDVNGLYRVNDIWKTVTDSTEYYNYDEDNFSGRPGFPVLPDNYHRIVKRSNLRVHYEERQWCEGRDMKEHGGVWDSDTAVPKHRFRLDGNKMIDVDTGDEIMMLHLGSKVWPTNLDGSPRWGCDGTDWDYFDREKVYRTWASKYPACRGKIP